MLTKSGAKLMDFGLARATGMAGPSSSGVSMAALTQSPTMAQPLTAEGTIVGTFQYMAPEQLEGKEADARSDLWSLGCVLYEMATGRRAFEGKSQASLIAAIMHVAPPALSEVAPLTPAGLERVVSACLAKDPDERIQTAHDVKLQLGWTTGEGSQAGAPAVVVRRRRSREAAAWVVGVLGVLAAAATLLLPRGGVGPVIRAIIPHPPNALFLFVGDNAGPPEISPDGRHVVFVAVDAERGARLWVRDVAALESRPLNGTENATFPFWSGDSRSIGFFADQKLKRVDLATGQVFAICAAPGGRGGTWNRGGQIVFAPDFQSDLSEVAAMGGEPRAVTHRDTLRQTTHRWPQFLPDGRHFLYFAGNHGNVAGPDNGVWIGSLDGRDNRLLLAAVSDAHYAEGYLFFVQDSVLMARPFDASSLSFRGDAAPTAERVQFDPTTWKANVSLSNAGLMIYQPVGGRQGSQIRLLDRAGHVLKTAGESGNHFSVRLSADGGRIIYSSQVLPNGDVFVYDFARDLTRRLTLTEDDEDMPTPSPDGRLIAFTSAGNNVVISAAPRQYVIKTLPLDGVGTPRVLYRGSRDAWPLDWSDDGRSMLIGAGNFSTVAADSIGVLSLDSPGPVRWFAAPAGTVNFGRFSHDGHWLAYGTVGVPEPQIYIQPVPTASTMPGAETSGRLQITSHGGVLPHWRKDDRELYYSRPDGMIVAVSLTPGTMQPGPEIPLFRAVLRPYFQALDVSPDGQRFVVNVLASEGAAPIALVSGWKQDLKPR
jgi:dipeptidyl aminopeptidase/acylaminoacyl peptidase